MAKICGVGDAFDNRTASPHIGGSSSLSEPLLSLDWIG
jgi:hypothetical protein